MDRPCFCCVGFEYFFFFLERIENRFFFFFFNSMSVDNATPEIIIFVLEKIYHSIRSKGDRTSFCALKIEACFL